MEHGNAPAAGQQSDEPVRKALHRAFSLGQTYWYQADSDSYKQNAKADETLDKFRTLVDETCATLPAAAACAEQGEEPNPTWVLLSRPGMSAQRKGPFRDKKLTEQMVRDLYELHPDATCLVIDAPHTTYPEDGREWVAMFGDQRRKRIPRASLPPPARKELSDEEILHLWDTHVAYETNPNRPKQPPLDNKDKLAFARAVLSASCAPKQTEGDGK